MPNLDDRKRREQLPLVGTTDDVSQVPQHENASGLARLAEQRGREFVRGMIRRAVTDNNGRWNWAVLGGPDDAFWSYATEAERIRWGAVEASAMAFTPRVVGGYDMGAQQ